MSKKSAKDKLESRVPASLLAIEEEMLVAKEALSAVEGRYETECLKLVNANLPEDLDPGIVTPFDHWDVEMPGVWKCPKSPTGMCVYHPDTDPCQDSCLYCHEPRERK